MGDRHIENVNHLKKKLDKGVSFEKTMHILYKLQKIPISFKLLVETGIGFKLRELSKQEKNNDVGKTAKLLIMTWKEFLKNSEDVDEDESDDDGRKNENHDSKNNNLSDSSEMDNKQEHSYRDRNNRHKNDQDSDEEEDPDVCDETRSDRSEASVSPQCTSSSLHKKKHKKKKKKSNKDNSDNEQEKREKRKEKKRKHRENDTDSIRDLKKNRTDFSKVNNKCDIKTDNCDNNGQNNQPQSSELKYINNNNNNNKLEPKMNRSSNGLPNNRLYNLNNDMFSAMLNMNDYMMNSKSKTTSSNSSSSSNLNRSNKSNDESTYTNQRFFSTGTSNLDKEIIRSCQQTNRYDPSFYQYYQPQRLENNAESQQQVNMIGMKFKGRTQVYAGSSKLVTVSEVYRLQDICIRVLMNHVDKIYEVGDLPYFILKPVFAKCTVQQLRRIEYHNPQLLEDTDELWREFCDKDFKTKQKGRDKFDSWRDFYNFLLEQREVKLRNITENINSKQRKAVPERKTMQIDLKTPREILRRRERNVISTGTNSLYPYKNVAGGASKMNPITSKPKPAPLMKKLLQIRQSKMRR